MDRHETPIGERWGGEPIALTAALQAGKLLAPDVQSDYAAFPRLEQVVDSKQSNRKSVRSGREFWGEATSKPRRFGPRTGG